VRTDDLRIVRVRPLLAPAILMEEIPLSGRAAHTVERGRRTFEAILDGTDPRLAVVVGPCSIHDPDAALDYADRLARLAERVAGRLLLVMRVYFEKPRTTIGWKGLINDPDLDGSYHINRGLRLARQLLADVAERGLPAGTEFLDRPWAFTPILSSDRRRSEARLRTGSGNDAVGIRPPTNVRRNQQPSLRHHRNSSGGV
jgi:3-deoxy-7-phosphoheptulonate synthase